MNPGRLRVVWTLTIVAMVAVVGSTAAAVLARRDGDDDRARAPLPAPLHRIAPDGNAVALTWTPVALPADANVTGIASGPHGMVVVGTQGPWPRVPTEAPPTPTIWFSADGVGWEPAHAETPIARERLQWRTATIGRVHLVNGRFVATGSVSDPGTRDHAALWVSDDGRKWTAVDPTLFAATTDAASTRRKRSTSASTIYDVTGRGEQIVVLGEVYTDSDAPAGLTSATWTSPDGVHWTRRFADLGTGFDPYFTSGVARGGRFLAAGRIGRFPGVVWASRDLRKWTAQQLTEGDGFATLATLGGGVFAAGTDSEGRDTRQAGQPTIWWSRDGRAWEPVLRLARIRSGRRYEPVGFGRPGAAASFALVPGPARRGSRPAVYVSGSGRKWARVADVPSGAGSGELDVLGEGDEAVYLQGTVLWRVSRAAA